MIASHAQTTDLGPLTRTSPSFVRTTADPVMATPLVVATAIAGATVGFTICIGIGG